VSPAAAWIVAVSAGPPDRASATLTDSPLPTSVVSRGEPALPLSGKSPRSSSSPFLPVGAARSRSGRGGPLCSDSRVVWHAHLGLHPLRNLTGFTGFVRNNNRWSPSKTAHVFARSCLLMSPYGEASDVATPSCVRRWDVAFLTGTPSQLARAVRRGWSRSGRERWGSETRHHVSQRGLFAVGAPCGVGKSPGADLKPLWGSGESAGSGVSCTKAAAAAPPSNHRTHFTRTRHCIESPCIHRAPT